MTLDFKKSATALAVVLLSAPALTAESTSKVVAVDDIEWGYLNPLRGELSPGAADLWGDRTEDIATGMLVRFRKGFESPPHIHNITYRGVVIDGMMHNDDPTAEKMWMPTGSFWTQPAGEDHTTAANGEVNLIYLEIDAGPYLVKPSKDKFDNGERPLNLHRDNIVWLYDSDLHNLEAVGVQSTYLWGNTAAINGSMLKLPSGFKGSISTESNEFRAVVISGEIGYDSKDLDTAVKLGPGSYIESEGNFTHEITNSGNEAVTIYVRSDDKYNVK